VTGNKRNAVEDGRINIRIEPGLKYFIKGYTIRKGTNITQIIVDHFENIRKAEEERTRFEPPKQI